MSAPRGVRQRPGEGFSDVDGSADPAVLVAYLDDASRLPELQEVDRWLARELRLAPGSHVLDVGCGTGEDTAELAAQVAPGGRALGLDVSAVMVREARRRAEGRVLPLEFRTGRAEALELPSGRFDACRFERVLQHLLSPAAALHEAARVLRAGGRLAAFEPDWTSLAVAGASPDVTARVLEAHAMTIPSPDVGARLPSLLGEAGFRDLRSEEVALVITRHEMAMRTFRLEAAAEAAVAGGAVRPAEAADWLQALSAADRRGAFRARLTCNLVSGTTHAGGCATVPWGGDTGG